MQDVRRPCFDKENGRLGVFCESVGNDVACGAAADDDIVIIYGRNLVIGEDCCIDRAERYEEEGERDTHTWHEGF